MHVPESLTVRRLNTYWKIEAGNVVLIPALAVYLVLRSGGKVSTALVLSGLACSFLLVIGTVVLRMMLRRARRGTCGRGLDPASRPDALAGDRPLLGGGYRQRC